MREREAVSHLRRLRRLQQRGRAVRVNRVVGRRRHARHETGVAVAARQNVGSHRRGICADRLCHDARWRERQPALKTAAVVSRAQQWLRALIAWYVPAWLLRWCLDGTT